MNPTNPENKSARNSSAKEVLLIEDNPGDALLVKEHLKDAPGEAFQVEWVDRLSKAFEHLTKKRIDVVLLDLSLPDSHGLETLSRVMEAHPDIPIVVLTSLDDDHAALNAVQQGSQDYLVKGNLHAHELARTLRYAIERKRNQVERERLLRELQEALAHVKTLTGLLPICSYCRKVRDDKGYWEQLEHYVLRHSQAEFTHGICPNCLRGLKHDIDPAG